jgi:hypothetical protein
MDLFHQVDEIKIETNAPFLILRDCIIGKKKLESLKITTIHSPFLFEQVWCGYLFIWGNLIVVVVAFSY